MISNIGRRVLLIGAVGLAIAGALPAFADGHDGGGGHFGGGGHAGGGHAGGGRMAAPAAHFGGGGHYGGGGHFGGGRMAAPVGHYAAPAARVAGGGHYAYRTGPRYAAAPAQSANGFRARQRFAAANNGHWNQAGDRGRWHGHHGDHDGDRGYPGWVGGYWGGGYWGNGFWPAVYYGLDFAWFLPILPAAYATYWYDGMPYYYADDVYYTWDPGYDGYVATDPPPVADGSSASGSGAAQAQEVSGQVYMYPKNGQSAEQQSADRRACQQWAANQTGGESGNQAYSDYRRAMVACAEGRGYSAR